MRACKHIHFRPFSHDKTFIEIPRLEICVCAIGLKISGYFFYFSFYTILIHAENQDFISITILFKNEFIFPFFSKNTIIDFYKNSHLENFCKNLYRILTKFFTIENNMYTNFYLNTIKIVYFIHKT